MKLIVYFLLSTALVAPALQAQFKTIVKISRGETVMEIDNEKEGVKIQTGVGYPPPWAKTQAQRIVWGINEARANAVINAAQALGQINVTSEQALEGRALKKREIETSFTYLLKGAQEYSIGQAEDGSYLAEIRLDLTGPDGVDQVLLPWVRDEYAKVPRSPDYYWEGLRPQPSPPQPTSPSTAAPSPPPPPPPSEEITVPEDYSAYTGLVIDARGFGLGTARAPRILAKNGQVLYDLPMAKLAESKGMVGYAASPDDKHIKDRIRDNPLQVKASGQQESMDVIVSNEDAGRIAHIAQVRNILAECRVVFVLDSE